jgi:predicted nucleic acid-binding protein
VTVIIDTSVLINFAHVGRFDLVGRSAGLRTLVPVEVLAEVVVPAQRVAVEKAIASGELEHVPSESAEELDDFARLRTELDLGESAVLAIAKAWGALVACDERGAFSRIANELLGAGRVVNTAGLIVRAIKRGLVTIDEADEIKGLLERRKFKMRFASFRELLPRDET